MIFVNFRLDHPILRDSLQHSPGVTLEWIRNQRYPANGWTMHYWALGDDLESYHDSLRDDPSIELLQYWEIGDRWLYHVEIVGEGAETDLYPILAESGSVIMSAEMTQSGWHLHIGFSDQSTLERFFESCQERGLEYEIHRVYEARDSQRTPYGLTKNQRNALLSALEHGYFDVPRRGDLDDLGRELGISDSAASQRLRRGLKKLVDETINDAERDVVP